MDRESSPPKFHLKQYKETFKLFTILYHGLHKAAVFNIDDNKKSLFGKWQIII